MKKVLLMLIVLGVFISVKIGAQNSTVPLCPFGDGWVYNSEFSDEFNQNGLDNEKWWDFNPEWVGRKPGYFARENVEVKEGTLQLTAKVQNEDEVTLENKVRGYDQFTTSSVKSKERIKYGYFEARCKAMKSGVCNAFWLYDPLDPPAKFREGSFSEEIDIFEVFGNPAKKEYDQVFFANVHRFYTPYVESIVNFKKMPLPKNSHQHQVTFDFSEDYHVYALLWTPEEMKWFIDGEEVFSRDNDYFNTALYIMFDCEIMEGWVGLPDPVDLPSTYYIDYLRVWQPKGLHFPVAENF